MKQDASYETGEDMLLDDVAYIAAFDNKTLLEVIEKVRSGDQEAKEEFYSRMNVEINEMAYSLYKKFHNYDNDESKYFEIVFVATEKALKAFDPSKGTFLHYWRKVITNEKKHFYRFFTSCSQINGKNIIHEGMDGDPEFFDFVCRDEGGDTMEDSMEEKGMKREIYEKIIDFCRKKFSSDDVSIVEMWSQGETLKGIADILNLTSRKVTTRLYRIIKVVRDNENEILGDDLGDDFGKARPYHKTITEKA